jgi:ATP-binding cassette, subfamily B, bacterial
MRAVRLGLVGVAILTGVSCSSVRAAEPAPQLTASQLAAPQNAVPVPAPPHAPPAGAQAATVAQPSSPAPQPVIGPAQEREVVWLCVAGVILSLLWTVVAWWRARATQRAREADTDPDPMAVARNGGGPAHKSPRLRQLFLGNLWRVKGSLLLAAFFTAGGAVVELLKPWPLKLLIDHSVLGRKLPHALAWLKGVAPDPFSVLVVSAIAIVVISVVGGVFSYCETFITKALGYKILYSLRREVFSHLQRLSLSFHNRARSGDLLTTFAKDTSTLKDVFAGDLLKFADEALSMIGMLWIMWWVNWRMCLIALASLPFLCFMLFHLYRQTKLSMRKQRKQDGRVTSRLNEVLAAMPLVQAYGREKHEEERYNHVSDQTLRESIRMSRLEAAAGRTSQLMSAVGTAAATLFGGMEVLQGRMMPGELVLLMTYVSNIYKPIRNLAKMSIDFSKVSASAERIAEILEVEPEIQDLPDAIDADRIRGDISFSNVSFDYGDGKEVLSGVSFDVRSGERLALVGLSGAGKSTIASLLLRLYEAEGGIIRIDGMDLKRFRRESFRRQVGVVLQQSVLFGATVRENIAYGKPDASEEEILAAARAASADEFIRELEDGYDAVIGERGVTLSAGQRQRIAIARAVIRNPRILILDEPMTGLDVENESRVREALDRLMAGKTTIMITHDLQSIADADQVLLLEDGRIAEHGTHAELVNHSGRYRELFDLGLKAPVPELARVAGG